MRLKLLTAAAVIGLFSITGANAARLTDQPLVDAAWLQQNLNAKGLVVLDVREVAKSGNPYASAHVPGAVDAPYTAFGWRETVDGVPGMLPPLKDIGAKIASLGIDNNTEVVIVPAASSADEFGDATRVYWTFKVLGHDNVAILNGGWNAWQAANAPVSSAAVTPSRGNFVPELRPEVLADVAAVQKAIKGDADLIDSRSVAQFIGKQKTNTVKEYGTLPTAVNIDFDQFWDAKTHTFASKAQIDALIQKAGLEDKQAIITFCNTGHLASIDWFGLSQIAGLPGVRMYDGSMSQWTSDPSRPVVIPTRS